MNGDDGLGVAMDARAGSAAKGTLLTGLLGVGEVARVVWRCLICSCQWSE